MNYSVRALVAAATSGVVLIGAHAAHAAVDFNVDGAVIGAVSDNVRIGLAPVSPPITVYANAGTDVNGLSFSVYADSIFNMSGGRVVPRINSNNTSIVNFSGGTATTGFQTNDTSMLNISGGISSYGVWAGDSSTVNIIGGTFTRGIQAYGQSVVNIRGGSLDASISHPTSLSENSVVNIYGTNLQATFVGTTSAHHNYLLSGVLEDGSSINGRHLSVRIGSGASFNLIPTPSAAVMLGLGGLAAMRRRRS